MGRGHGFTTKHLEFLRGHALMARSEAEAVQAGIGHYGVNTARQMELVDAKADVDAFDEVVQLIEELLPPEAL